MTKKLILLSAVFFSSTLLFSQNILWEEHFENGIPTTWIQDDLTAGNATWSYCDAQSADPTEHCPKIWNDDQNEQTAFASTTVSDGFLTFDSDQYWIENPTQNHDLFIETEPILVDGTEEVWIKFEYQIGVYINQTFNNAFLDVLAGSNLKRYQIKPIQIGDNPYPEFIRWSRNPEIFFVNASAIADGQSTIKLKWRWSGFGEYFWAIDDIVVYDKNPMSLWLPENDLEATEFIAVHPNKQTPYSQTEPFGFFGDVINRSYLPAKGVQFDGQIIYENQTIFKDSVIIDSIGPNSLEQNILFPNEIPAFSEVGRYIGEYAVINENDETPENNKMLFEFEITDNVFAKDNGISAYARPPDFRWAQNAEHNWAWGNIYYVPNGNGFKATGISFAFRKDDSFDYTDIIGVGLTVQLYEWNDTIGANNSPADGICQSSERQLIGVGDYTVTGNETQFSMVYQSFYDDQSLNLKNDQHYIALVKFNSQVGASDIELGAHVETRYGSTLLRSQLVDDPRYVSALWISDADDKDFDMLGFGYDITPTVQLHIDAVSTSTEITQIDQDFISLIPNPTVDYFQILNNGFEFDQLQDLQLKIYGIDGRLLLSPYWGNEMSRSEKVNVGQLSAGIYKVIIGNHETDYFSKNLIVQ